MGQRSTGTRLERNWNERVTRQLVSFRLKLRKNEKKSQDCSISAKNKKAVHSPMFNHHSKIPWGSFRGRQEEKWGSFRGQFGDHFRVGDHFGVGIISGAVQHYTNSVVNVTPESFENWTLCLARTRFYLSFVGLWKNTANGKEACQDDRVQVCLLSYLSKELLIFS